MLFRVQSAFLDERKNWYAIKERICGPAFLKYRDNSFFQLFPNEVQKVPYCSLTSDGGGQVDPKWFRLKYHNRDILVTSTLGLCGGLLPQKELGDKSYLASDSFRKIAEVINCFCAIMGQPRDGANSQNTTLGNHESKTQAQQLSATFKSRRLQSDEIT